MEVIKWLVLDNLKNRWPYWTNVCDRDKADAAYRWGIESELIENGIITPAGIAWLLTR